MTAGLKIVDQNHLSLYLQQDGSCLTPIIYKLSFRRPYELSHVSYVPVITIIVRSKFWIWCHYWIAEIDSPSSSLIPTIIYGYLWCIIHKPLAAWFQSTISAVKLLLIYKWDTMIFQCHLEFHRCVLLSYLTNKSCPQTFYVSFLRMYTDGHPTWFSKWQ